MTTQAQQPVTSKALQPTQGASLYVGDLDPTVDESELFQLFSQAGTISSIKVCRDSITKASLGYAYVNFVNLQDAERALDTLNNVTLKQNPIRIMWSQRDPSLRRSGVGNIFIKNLDKKITHKEIYDTFSIFGNILSCKVATDRNGNSKGFGFVHFESVDAANKAINALNGNILGDDNDNPVYVGKFIPRRERQKQTDLTWTNVFVKNLPREYLDEAKFNSLFTPHGTIVSSHVREPSTNNPKDPSQEKTVFGFVNFETHEQAKKAVEEMDSKDIDGKIITVCRAQKKKEREEELRKKADKNRLDRQQRYQGLNLYVKNFDDDVDEAKLREIFSPFGNIKSAKVEERDGVKLGFGYVCFSLPEEANKALAELNGKIVPGNNKPLYVNLFESKETRAAKAQQYLMMRSRRPPHFGYPPFFPQGPYVPQGPKGRQYYPQQFVGGPQMYGTGPYPKAQRKGHPMPTPNSREAIGHMLHTQILEVTKNPTLAGKITGMLLSRDMKECEGLVRDRPALMARIDEAKKVLDQAQAQASK